MLHKENRFLALLPQDIFSRMVDHLGPADMLQGQVIAEAHQPIQHVYFPRSSIVSYVVEMGDGNMIETAMIGRDGVVGAIQALDEKVSPNKIVVQVPGKASFIDADKTRALITASPQLRVLLAKHEQLFISQVQQSVGCAASHLVERLNASSCMPCASSAVTSGQADAGSYVRATNPMVTNVTSSLQQCSTTVKQGSKFRAVVGLGERLVLQQRKLAGRVCAFPLLI